jgi:hypothetical protein
VGSEEVILAVLPLPMDVHVVAKVLRGLTGQFPGALCRDAAHSGYYTRSTAGYPDMASMEVFLPTGYVIPEDDEEDK